MEVCGGQTHAIARDGLEDLLPDGLDLVHGPGCPVCVTPVGVIEAARHLALRPGTALCTYGDMVRVPGLAGDLLDARAHGGDVRVVTSPLDAVTLARARPDLEVVFFAVGFETTAPATATAVELARRLGLPNFSVLGAHVRVPPAMAHILSAGDNRVQAFLAAGHVCTVTGTGEYEALVARFGVPIVATGFEPVDILLGLVAAVEQLEAGEARVDNRYARAVASEGSVRARAALDAVFEPADRPWRGLGVIPGGGLALRPHLRELDAGARFELDLGAPEPDTRCRAAEVLQGRIRPTDCAELGQRCTPDSPLGAPMVSSEGACAAYYRYRRRSP